MAPRKKTCPGCQLPAAKKKHWWGSAGRSCKGPLPSPPAETQEGMPEQWSSSPSMNISRPEMKIRLRRGQLDPVGEDQYAERDHGSPIILDDEQNTETDPSPLLLERLRLEEENEQMQLELLRQRNAKLRLELQQQGPQETANHPQHAQPQDLWQPMEHLQIGHVGPAIQHHNPQPKQQRTGNYKEPLRIVDFLDFDKVADNGTKQDPRTLDSVSISEWNVANIRIMYSLLEAGELSHETRDIGEGGTLDGYLSYTVKIMEYAGQFPWKNVLKYDQAFRHKQATKHLTWEDDNQHLVTVHLVSPLHQQKASTRQKRPTGKPICRMYNYPTGCTFSGCAYIHKCNVPGCVQQHPAHMHNAGVGTQYNQSQNN